LAADGQTTATGNLKMGNNRITGLADGIASTDAPSLTQVTSAVAITGGTITGASLTNDTIDNSPIGNTTRSTVKATTLDLGLSTQSVAIGQGNASLIKNRIINGAMVIDQRNAGASVNLPDGAASYSFVTDRFACSRASGATATGIQSSTAPVGFNNSLLITNGTGITVANSGQGYILQYIEGYNIADLGWGTANAKTVTLSFWVQSSITGTHSGALNNSSSNRSYPFTFAIPTANTWTQISITIAGDTTGTWLTTNGRGIVVTFNNGSGSTYLGTANAWAGATYFGATGSVALNSVTSATFYITGVQLEVGSSATGFEYVNYQTSLANCQRYFVKTYGQSVAVPTTSSSGFVRTRAYSGVYGAFVWLLPVSMRTAPTAVIYNQDTSTVNSWRNVDSSTNAVAGVSTTGEQSITVESSALTTNETYLFQLTGSAEL
jgi:hypothetical protein